MAKVFIGIGHGGSDNGATYGSLNEKEINLTMAMACREKLIAHGVEVGVSRWTNEETDTVSQEVQECNQYNPDITIEIHNNAGGGDGFECFYWVGDSNGKRLANLIENHVQAIGQNSRGCKDGKKLHYVNSTKMTCVLCEGFFLDNEADNQIADTVEEQKMFGYAYANAILEYFNIATNIESKPQEKLYCVQVGAFKNKENANKLATELSQKGYATMIKGE